jgi:hypothetical protein
MPASAESMQAKQGVAIAFRIHFDRCCHLGSNVSKEGIGFAKNANKKRVLAKT